VKDIAEISEGLEAPPKKRLSRDERLQELEQAIEERRALLERELARAFPEWRRVTCERVRISRVNEHGFEIAEEGYRLNLYGRELSPRATEEFLVTAPDLEVSRRVLEAMKRCPSL
jgi:ribosomal protein L32E